MKKILLCAAVIGMSALMTGCIIAPPRGGGYYHPHYYRGW